MVPLAAPRFRWLLAVFALGALLFWRPLRHQVLAALALFALGCADTRVPRIGDAARGVYFGGMVSTSQLVSIAMILLSVFILYSVGR